MESSYITALETRMKWLQWGLNEGRDQWKVTGRAAYLGGQSFLRVLEGGDTYFMNKRFCSLVDNARSTVPDELQFESSWMLSPQGWMWIEDPFLVPQLVHEKSLYSVKISAIGWLPINEGLVTADYMEPDKKGRIAGRGAYQFLCFLDYNHIYDFSTQKKHKEGFGTWSYFMLQDGDNLIERIRQFEKQASVDGGAYDDNRTRDMLHEIRWIYSAMYLMAQRLSVTVTHNTDRATRRRAVREKREVPSFIKVVSLRRFEEEKVKAKTTGNAIEWQWQWTVRGHWRNQYYPSTGEYKPKFIESFIKGPADKPLKPDSVHVFVARR